MPRYQLTNGLAVLAAVLCACAKEAPVVEVMGECAVVYQAELCTWARMQGTTVVAVGATVPLASIENAPDDQRMVWPPVQAAALRMPESGQQQGGLTEVTVFWEPHGHPPGPYLTPHFDFHFYTITTAERAAIDCVDQTKPTVLPAGYSLPDVTLPPPLAEMAGESPLIGLCVAEMGMHSLLTSELESTDTFRGSMVIGYYHGISFCVFRLRAGRVALQGRSLERWPWPPSRPQTRSAYS
jgi:hypothetical protein